MRSASARAAPINSANRLQQQTNEFCDIITRSCDWCQSWNCCCSEETHHFILHPDVTSNLYLFHLAFQPSRSIIEPYSTGIISPARAEVVGSILCTGENTLIYCSPSLNSPGEMEFWSLRRLIIVFSPSIPMPPRKIKPPLLGQLSPVTWLKGGDGGRESGIKTPGRCQPIVTQPPTTHTWTIH